MPPPELRRRVLVITTGLSPQVVTETLWALAIERSPAWTPDQIVLLTTSEGGQRARSLIGPDGQIAQMARDYERPDILDLADAVRVELAGEEAPLADVDSEEAHGLAADQMMAVVRALTADETAELHVSIAGGRKSQGALLALCLSLFGREGDTLSHVLADERFLGRSDFYYPPPRPRKLQSPDGGAVSTDDARVRLAPLPFPRLRARLPAEAFAAARLADVVGRAQQAIEPPRLELCARDRSARLAQTPLALPPALFAWLAVLAEDRAAGGEGLPRNGLLRERLASWRGPGRNRSRRAEDEYIDADRTEEWSSRLNKLVSARVPVMDGRRLIETVGKRPHARYRLSLGPGDIRWLNP